MSLEFSNLLRTVFPWLLPLGLAGVCGCDSGPELIPVSGQVSIDGKPLTQGMVTIWTKGYRPGYGAIDSSGHFVVTTHANGDGCIAGEHLVTVTSETSSKGDVMQYFIPKRYKEPGQSGLKLEVTQPIENWQIELTWAGDVHSAPFTEQ